MQSLPDPQSVQCYYFRNKNGLFLGELEPYYKIPDDTFSFDHTDHWSLWEKHLPNIEIMDIDASNHMMMLSEAKVYESILEFCRALYTEEGVSRAFVKSFKQKTKRMHGTLDLRTIKKAKKKKKTKSTKK